ncbi:PVC-type heme-binding CxxCH protein [Fimbriiglobus ruber]|uniref:Dehydrogenase n=1 Tax=Fimbriiglobus ruber TaxID=1908690 RepID=A0A225DPY4_9BACT|nr:PVC-type heme-binding CxxCH protein [Fimbriiglobus ruber]OWK43163.1 dehydrogenase [Fimbriiglobus ruber]
MRQFLSRALSAGLALLAAAAGPALAADPPKLEFKVGDKIAVVGNALADRMQHDAWLDAYLHTRFADLNLAFRHMGFSADEVGGFTDRPNDNVRLRSAAFGSNDEWMKRVGADVVFAFFGYNESFAGQEGLEAFKKELDGFVKHTLKQQYNGKSAARVVLFSPIAQESQKGRDLPDPSANNAQIALYTTAIAEVAKANNVPFVDLFKPTTDLYARVPGPLTINGLHLTTEGNHEVAKAIDIALFGGDGTRDTALLEKVRKAAQDRNFHWFERYRTTDGYSVFGGRADLAFVGGQTNRIVAQREMQVLDAMTANRDRVVWAASKGQDVKPDDSNTPAFIPVTTNKPGKGPNGIHLFLSGEEAIKSMTVAKGAKVTLFADEKMFPALQKPVQMAWDAKGRLWVAVWPSYPHWKPKEEMNDKLLIFEDTDGDGKADKMTVFADKLHNPTGFEFYNGGVLIAQAPDLMFLKDTDGDDKADVRVRVLHGLDSADTHHTANSFVLDPGGALYFQEGTFHHTSVETPYGPPQRVANGAVMRYEPRAQKFDVYVSYGFANPHGHVFDLWGQDIVVDGTGAVPYHGPLFSSYLPYPQKHNGPPTVYNQRTRPCPGMEYLAGTHFPPEFQGNLLVGNVIGFQGILRYKIEDDGGSLKGTEIPEPLVSSTDPNFRPSDLKTGPDGALYFIDWHNPIIGHMQHNLRDPSRDRDHGRIYKVTYEGRPLDKPAKIAGEPIPALLDLLKSTDDRARYRAKIELGARNSAEVTAAAKKWAAGLDAGDPHTAHNKLEALWVHQYHNIVDVDLLKEVLASKDFHARAAAVRVLTYWRDRVPGALEMMKKLAADESPRVRLMAVWGASYFTAPDAIEVVLVAEGQEPDRFVEFVGREAKRVLEPQLAKAISAKKDVKFTTPQGAKFFLKSIPTDELVKLQRTPGVFTELLSRPAVRDEIRKEAAAGLAEATKKPEMQIILDAIRAQDKAAGDESVAYDLTRLLTGRGGDLAAARAELEALATTATTPVMRQLAYTSLVAADGSPDKAWALATQSISRLRDFVTAIPQIRDPNLRAALYPKITALLAGLPGNLSASLPKNGAIYGRYVRVELPGRQRTLTLAEVEVYSDGKNVARGGKATQSSTSHGGDASHGIDGNKSPTYGDGGQTHSLEGENNPWWQVDLGTEYPIDSIVIYNRADGALGTRLNGFTLKVLDTNKSAVFTKEKNPTPNPKTAFTVGGESPERVIRRAAMLALTSVRGKEADTFKTLAKFVKDGSERQAAIQAIQRIPADAWPKDDALPLLAVVTQYVASVPEAGRTAPAVLDALQFADAIAGKLPKDEAKAARKALGALGVRVIRVGTLTDQMLFDKERLVVQAGKPVEFVFENTDIMPHNFVIVQPGALEEVGLAGEEFGTKPGAQERNFVPPSGKILLSSRLLQPRDGQVLRFNAPTKPGVYPYVCTYPGHWRRMYGSLYVVADLDEFTDAPEQYLAKNPLPIQDKLLEFNRPRTDWKFDELSPLVADLDKGGRSFAAGKQMFTVATCVACHKFGGEGQDFGPDLTKLDEKIFKSPADVLRHVLEPSLKVDDKYKSYTFNLAAGGVVTGMILEETPTAYKVIENPLAKADARVLKKDDVDGKPKPNPTSMMPVGLLGKLQKDEILDLLAYVAAKADAKHKFFQGDHHGKP